jgi:hypothetical protein
MNSADVVAFWEHLLREVPGRLVLIWDGAPIHRGQGSKMCSANGAAQQMHLERLPAYAPTSIRARGSGHSSKASSCATSAAALSRIYGMSCVTRLNGFGEHRACFKAFSEEQDFSSLGPGQ